MCRWWDLLATLPVAWQRHTLFCYRGHAQAQGEINAWLRALPGDVDLGYYQP